MANERQHDHPHDAQGRRPDRRAGAGPSPQRVRVVWGERKQPSVGNAAEAPPTDPLAPRNLNPEFLREGLEPLGGAGHLMALRDTYLALIPQACREDHARTLSVLETLFDMQVTPAELSALVGRGIHRDGWRSVISSELVYALSFCAANAASLALPPTGPLEEGAYGQRAADLVEDLNSTATFMLASGIIAVGAEGALAIVREGKMGPKYNVATVPQGGATVPFTESKWGPTVQGLSALPFGAAYMADDYLRDQAQTPLAWRLLFGAGAAAMSAVFRNYCAERAVDRLDPIWLDASTDEKRAAMRRAIQDLRQSSVAAVAGYVAQHLVPGMSASPGETLSAKGAVRTVTRLVAATLARAGAVTTSAMGADRDLRAKLISDLWLGVSWGYLSTWPQRLLDRAAAGRAQEPNAPVMARPPALSVAPAARSAADPYTSP